MKKLLPLIFLLFGSAAGGGVGFVLRPAPPEVPAEMAKDEIVDGHNRGEKQHQNQDDDVQRQGPHILRQQNRVE